MRELLSLLPRPSRYAGIEEGAVLKPDDAVTLRVGLAFPDLYEVGMSYLGQKILYGVINSRDGWQAERVFTPCREAGAILRAHGAPLCTLESDTPLAELDALGFSLTHELCYTNVLFMLDLAGIPLRAKDRLNPKAHGKPWPLILAGGGCTLAGEPMAPFMDIMLLGEAEEALPEVLDLLQNARSDAWDRRAFLPAAARVPGVYVPEFFTDVPNPETDGAHVRPLVPGHETVTRRVVRDMDKAAYPISQPVPFNAVHNRLALEIGRGCTRGCRFCQAGSIYRPARERSVAGLSRLLEQGLASAGFDDVSFLSLSTGDFSALKELFMSTVAACRREQISVSLPSLRVGSIDDAIMEQMAGIRRTGATLAPEAGSQRLRDVINKGVTEEELILHVQKLYEHGWRQVKLYFMLGLPTETDEDLLAIVDLCKRARDAAGPGIKSLQITASVSPFVPKAHTPFQWEAQIPLAEIRRRVGFLLDAVKQEKRIRLRWHEPEMSALEGLFSRADRRLADVVESAYAKGALFCSWMEGFSLAPWLEALAEHGLSMEPYLAERSQDAPLPWDHLKSGLSREFLLRERKRSRSGAVTRDCRYTACKACGVCDTKAAPSLLDPLPGGDGYANILNKPERDQEAHTVATDHHGRVLTREEREGTAPARPEKKGGTKAKPPALAPHLAVKTALVRFWYRRAGRAVFLSQLELQSIIERALRRAKAPLSFSQGFHPLPIISFGRALSVGIASECEWFCVTLREHRPLQELLEAMNKGLPRGLSLTRAENLPVSKKGQPDPDAAREIFLAQRMGSAEEKQAFARAWRTVAGFASLPWRRETKKGVKELDARALFAHISWNEDHSVTLTLDWSAGYASPLALCLHVLAAAGLSLTPPQLALTKTARE